MIVFLEKKVQDLENQLEARNKDVDTIAERLGAIMAYLVRQEHTFRDDMLLGNVDEELLAKWGVKGEFKGQSFEFFIL